jgi:primary-amine oxidase
MMLVTRHPLDPLDRAEICAAVEAVRDARPDLQRPAFVAVALKDPAKDEVVSHSAGERVERRAQVVVLERGSGRTFEAVVSLDGPALESWRRLEEVHPPVLADEFGIAIEAARADPRFLAALERRGIEDPERVQVDALAAGSFPHYPAGRRIVWALPYLRERDEQNGYGRPIENLRALIDIGSGEVIDVVDGEPVPLPTAAADYDEQAVGGYRADPKPLEIVQPDGPGFTVEGNVIRWQGWSLHAALHPVDGLVLSDLRYDGRQILYRASIAEMVVPYGEPADGHYWRSYFDAGEYGLGRMTNSLEHGCDCLGEIVYLDAVLADPAGEPQTISNAICLHEEDHGILWRHWDWYTDDTQVRRSRRLVVSSVATVGNYDYGFYWSLYQDGSIELEVKLTGIILARAVRPEDSLRHSNRVAPDLAGPHHQHLFCARLDVAVDGLANTVYETDLVRAEDPPENPYGGAMEVLSTRIESEREARRSIDPVRSRSWVVVNHQSRNAIGEPVGYKLVPYSGPVLLARPDSSVGRRAAFASAHLWVTRYAPDELHPAGDYPNLHPGGDGISAWVQADRSLVDEDIVLWHVFGTSHAVRPEDWPVMPVERIGFALKPAGFFDRNPAIDVPPPASGPHCHPKEE